jgi:hypothetical protein
MSDSKLDANAKTLDIVCGQENAGQSLYFTMAQENECLRVRIAELERALIDARHNGLIYWSPQTVSGAVARAAMIARIDAILNKKDNP